MYGYSRLMEVFAWRKRTIHDRLLVEKKKIEKRIPLTDIRISVS